MLSASFRQPAPSSHFVRRYHWSDLVYVDDASPPPSTLQTVHMDVGRLDDATTAASYAEELAVQAARDYSTLFTAEMNRIERSVDLLSQSTQELLSDLHRVHASLTRAQREYFANTPTNTDADEQSTSAAANGGGNVLTNAMRPVRLFHSATNMLHVR